MITGGFISVDVPATLEVGDTISPRVAYKVTNDKGSLLNPWQVVLIIVCPVTGLEFYGSNVALSQNCNFDADVYLIPKQMPNSDIVLSFFLFASEDSGKPWDWSAFNMWLNGETIDFQYLGSAYKTISVAQQPIPPSPIPPSPTPIEHIFTGEITDISPLEQRIGAEISLVVGYNVKTSSLTEAINGWWAESEVKLDGLSGKAKSGMLTGYGSHQLSNQANLGVMPNRTLYGTVTVTCYKGGFSGYSEVVTTKNITVTPSALPPVPPTPSPTPTPTPTPSTCSIDSDCPTGYVCVNGECVKKEGNWWDKLTQNTWFPAYIGGAVAFIVLVIPSKHSNPNRRTRYGKKW